MGRRKILIFTAVGSAVAYAIFGLAGSLPFFFLSRALGGACAASIATAQAYVADVTTPEQRGRGMAMIGAALGAGFVFGPALAGVTAGWWGIRAPFFIASGMSVVSAIWTTLAVVEPPRHRVSEKRVLGAMLDAFRVPALAFYIVIFFLVIYAFSHIEATFPLWNFDELGFDERANGKIFAYIGLVLMVVQVTATPRLIRRLGEKRVISIGTIMMGIGCGVVPLFVRNWIELMVACTLMGGGNGLVNPAVTAAVSRSAPAHRQGEMLGVAQAMASGARIAGPTVGTFLYGHAGRPWPYLTTAVLLLLVGVVVSATRAGRIGTPTEQ